MEYLFSVYINSIDKTKQQHTYSTWGGVQYYVLAPNMNIANKKALEWHIEIMSKQNSSVVDSDGSLVRADADISYYVSKIEFVSDRLIK